MPVGGTLLARVVQAAAIWVSLGVIAGCARAEPQPEEVMRRFLADLGYGRADAVWAALTKESQESLTARHLARAQALGDPPAPKPAQILYEELGLELLADADNVVVASPIGPEVLVRISVKDGKSAEIRMLREGNTWKVDLLSALKPAPPLEAELKGAAAPLPEREETDLP